MRGRGNSVTLHEEGKDVIAKTSSLILSVRSSLLYVLKDLEPPDCYSYSGLNQNPIGKSPGAKPLDHFTHSSMASSVVTKETSVSPNLHHLACRGCCRGCCLDQMTLVQFMFHFCAAEWTMYAKHPTTLSHVSFLARYVSKYSRSGFSE